MPHTHGVIAVGDLQGASVTVTITDERAEQPTVYTDESGESAADNPATVTEATRFHVGRPGSYTVVLAIGSVPVGGGTVYLDGSEASFAPAVSAVELAQYLGGGSGLPVPGSGDAGKVVTVTGGEDGFELDAPAGGASEPSVQHFSHSFAFDTAGLADGVAAYTPAVGDLLIDCWIVFTEAFDGTSFADIGVASYGTGFLSSVVDGTPYDATATTPYFPYSTDVTALSAQGGTGDPGSLSMAIANKGGGSAGVGLPFTAATTTPWAVWVSESGYADGSDPGATVGAGVAHFLVVKAS